jgi:hypothetical protein
VEGDEPPALITHQVVMVFARGEHRLETSLTLPNYDALDQAMFDEQIKDAVDTCPGDRVALGAQSVFDLNGGQRTVLVRQ